MYDVRLLALVCPLLLVASQVDTFDATRLGRFLVPVVTPLDETGAFDEDSFSNLVSFLAKGRANGLYVGGSTGEGLHLEIPLRRALATAAVREARLHRMTTIIHVGAAQTKDALHLGVHAKEAGADAVSALPPFVGGASFEDVLSFYERLAETVAPLPVIAYYIPAVTKSELSIDQLVTIANIKVKHIHYALYCSPYSPYPYPILTILTILTIRLYTIHHTPYTIHHTPPRV
jgi:dihydrodipicolinate synthase/N-acetylneuraminate lyase